MIFDHNSVLQNKKRANKIGRNFFLHKLACKNLEDRISDLEITLNEGIVFGAEKEDFLRLDRKIKIGYYDFFEQRVINQKSDIVLNILNLHWSNNPSKDLSSQIALLKPGGVFFCCLFGVNTLKELRDSFLKAEMEILGIASPRVSPLPDIRDIGNLANNLGLKRCVADRELLTNEYGAVIELLKCLRAMGETNATLERKKCFSRRDVFDLMTKYYQKNYRVSKNQSGIKATFEIIFLYGEKNK
tara:strand:- start:612 stop:1343 length:732 start_codon:yes stop_codon:yes gene_type:complete